MGIALFDGLRPLRAIRSGMLLPGAQFAVGAGDLSAGTTRAVVYSFDTGPAASPRCADLGTVIDTIQEFQTLDAQFAAGEGGPPIGVAAQSGGRGFSNGAEASHNLQGFPLVGRSFGGEGVRTLLTVRHDPDEDGITAVAVFLYDSAGLHDYFCLELRPDEEQTVDLDDYFRVPPGFVGSLVVAAFIPVTGGGPVPGEGDDDHGASRPRFRPLDHGGPPSHPLPPQGVLARVTLKLLPGLDRFLGLPARSVAPPPAPDHAERLGTYDPVFGGYGYYLFPVSATPTKASVLTLSNTDASLPASVDVWGFPADGGPARFARRIAQLGAGQTVQVNLRDLIRGLANRFTGSLWLRASQPLIVTTGSGGTMLAAVPETVHDAQGTRIFRFDAAAGTRLEAGGFMRGGDFQVAVQNLSGVVAAKVQVSFVLDEQTVRRFDMLIPPQAVTILNVPRSVVPQRDVVVTVDSLPYFAPGGPLIPAPDVAGYALSRGKWFILEGGIPEADH